MRAAEFVPSIPLQRLIAVRDKVVAAEKSFAFNRIVFVASITLQCSVPRPKSFEQWSDKILNNRLNVEKRATAFGDSSGIARGNLLSAVLAEFLWRYLMEHCVFS